MKSLVARTGPLSEASGLSRIATPMSSMASYIAIGELEPSGNVICVFASTETDSRAANHSPPPSEIAVEVLEPLCTVYTGAVVEFLTPTIGATSLSMGSEYSLMPFGTAIARTTSDASTLMEAAMAERRRPTGGGFMMNSEECTADRSAGWMGSGLDECVLKSSVLTRGKH